MSETENLDQKIQHFLILMDNLRKYEEATGESGDFEDDKPKCESCGNSVCKMIQKNNPPLLCYKTYYGLER